MDPQFCLDSFCPNPKHQGALPQHLSGTISALVTTGVITSMGPMTSGGFKTLCKHNMENFGDFLGKKCMVQKSYLIDHSTSAVQTFKPLNQLNQSILQDLSSLSKHLAEIEHLGLCHPEDYDGTSLGGVSVTDGNHSGTSNGSHCNCQPSHRRLGGGGSFHSYQVPWEQQKFKTFIFFRGYISSILYFLGFN